MCVAGLVDTAQVAAGQRVLIHGAGGGVGHLAVQIAKAHGAHVIGTASAAKHDLVASLGADELIANKMQFVGGKATGKVIPPIIEGANKANAIRSYCVREGLALDQCHGYSDSASDYAMLAVVGRPTAVNPDMRLRSIARAYNWPILDLK